MEAVQLLARLNDFQGCSMFDRFIVEWNALQSHYLLCTKLNLSCKMRSWIFSWILRVSFSFCLNGDSIEYYRQLSDQLLPSPLLYRQLALASFFSSQIDRCLEWIQMVLLFVSISCSYKWSTLRIFLMRYLDCIFCLQKNITERFLTRQSCLRMEISLPDPLLFLSFPWYQAA